MAVDGRSRGGAHRASSRPASVSSKTDIKKVAGLFDRSARLGYMFLGAGVGAFHGGVLSTSSRTPSSKACPLPSVAGSAIHAMHARIHDGAGPRRTCATWGALRKWMPPPPTRPSASSCLAIAGFPLTSGLLLLQGRDSLSRVSPTRSHAAPINRTSPCAGKPGPGSGPPALLHGAPRGRDDGLLHVSGARSFLTVLGRFSRGWKVDPRWAGPPAGPRTRHGTRGRTATTRTDTRRTHTTATAARGPGRRANHRRP